MFAVFVGNGVAFGAWAGNIPRLKAAAGLGNGALGVVLLFVSIGAVTAMPVAGRFAGWVGTGRGCWLAGLALLGALPLMGVAPGMGGLLVAAMVLGAALGTMDVCMNAHAAAVERRRGVPMMSSFHAGWSLGQLAGAGLAGVLAGVGLVASLVVAGVVTAGLGLAACWFPGEARAEVAGGRARLGWPSRRLVGLCALIGLGFALEGATADWSGVYLQVVVGVPVAWAFMGLAAYSGAAVALRLGGDRLVRWLGPVRVVAWGGAVAGVGFAVALAAGQMGAVAVAGFGLVGVGLANVVPVVFSLAAQAGRPGEAQGAAGVAAVAMAGYGAVMVAPPVIGFLSQEVGLRGALGVLVVGAGVMVALARGVR